MRAGETDTPAHVPAGRRSGTGDVLTGAAVAGGGLVLLVSALGIEGPVRPAPGIEPATLPTALSSLLVFSGLALLVLGLRRRRVLGIEGELMTGGAADEVDELLHAPEPAVPWKRLVVVVGLFVGYAFVFIPLGYLLSTALFLVAVTTFVDPARWKRNLLFGVIFVLVVYYSFTQFLSVRLPAGLLG